MRYHTDDAPVLPDKVQVRTWNENEYWTYIANDKRLEKVQSKLSGINGGKYLFFSKNRTSLIEIGQSIIRFENIAVCKVSRDIKNSNYVLCVYDTEPIHDKEVSVYQSEEVIYRGWKSNLKTHQEHNIKGEIK